MQSADATALPLASRCLQKPYVHVCRSGRVLLGEREPEFLLVIDEASQLCAVEWLELRASFLKSLPQLRIV